MGKITEKIFNSQLVLFLKGLLMGVSNIVPGVSGGTIALITGIYDTLIESIDNISIREGLDSINFKFLLPLVLGISISMLMISYVMGFLFENYVSLINAFFFGLISASSIVTYKEITKKINLKIVIFTLIGFSFSFTISGMQALTLLHSNTIIFISGFLAISGLLLPGISGGFILLLLGQYEYMLNVLKNFNTEYVEVIIFMLGALVSVFTFTRVINWLLKNYRTLTYSFLIGLILGGLRLPLSEITFTGTYVNAISILGTTLAGLIIVLALEFKC